VAATFLSALALVLASSLPSAGQPRLKLEARLALELVPLAVEGDVTRRLDAVHLDVGDGRTERRRVEVGWSDGTVDKLEIEATGSPGPPDGANTLALRARWTGSDGRRIESRRRLALRQGSTAFHEVLREPGRSLTLAVVAENVQRPVLAAPSAGGRRVAFELEVEKVSGEAIVPLETNFLNTFVGEPVSYAFRRGSDETLEQLSLELRPTRVDGEIVTVEFRLSGALHRGSEVPLYLSRYESLVTNLDTASTVSAAVGEPPEGYRFVITPRF